MLIPTPDTMTVSRMAAPSDGSTYTTPTAVYTAIPCWFTPVSSMSEQNPFGPFPDYDVLCFVDYSYTIQVNDIITNLTDNTVYVVYNPPQKWRNPTTMQWHHQEIQLKVKM